MSLRISRLAILGGAALVACSPSGNERYEASTASSPTTTSSIVSDDRVPCQHGNAAPMKRCTVERDNRTGVLTIRFPDGGFRRVAIVRDGHGIVAADGAQPAQITLSDAGAAAASGGVIMADILIGHDRFRLPAHLMATAAARGER